MTIKKNDSRQEIIVAYVDIGFADVPTTATGYDALGLPVGAVVVGGAVVVKTAFNTATSAVLDVGDGATGNRYLNDVDLKTVGRTPLVPTGFTHSAVQNMLKVTPTYVGAAATAGAARLEVQYYVEGRSAFTQG